MSSGSPSHTVHEVGGPCARQAEELPGRDAEQLPLQVVQRGVERRLARPARPARRASALLDLLEGERVVADERAVLLDESQGRLGRLAVALVRRALAPPDMSAVAERDLHQAHLVATLARDAERLRQAGGDDAAGDLHGRSIVGRARRSAAPAGPAA